MQLRMLMCVGGRDPVNSELVRISLENLPSLGGDWFGCMSEVEGQAQGCKRRSNKAYDCLCSLLYDIHFRN